MCTWKIRKRLRTPTWKRWYNTPPTNVSTNVATSSPVKCRPEALLCTRILSSSLTNAPRFRRRAERKGRTQWRQRIVASVLASFCEMCGSGSGVGQIRGPFGPIGDVSHKNRWSREKNTCAEVPNARAYSSGLSVVLTPLVAYKGIAIACKRYTLIWNNIAHTTLMSVTIRKTATTQTVAILRKKNLVFAECYTTSSLSSGRRAPNLRRSNQMVGLVAIELVSRMESVVSLTRFLI